MLRPGFRAVAWLVSAVYLLDGVLAGAAHMHGPQSGECCQAVTATETTHSHGGCPHDHGHLPTHAAADSHESVPAVPHDHDDCAACRYSSLSAPPVALAVLPELTAEVEFVSPAAPARRAVKLVSECRSRAPPSVA